MTYFNPRPASLEELKRQYHALARKHHPDMGGSTSEMQAINREYEELFESLKNRHESASGEVYTAREETTETPEEFMAIINALVGMEGLEIELCGSWLWVTGKTYTHRASLKDLGFRFSAKKIAWYFHFEPFKKHSKKSFTLDEIRDTYGSQKIKSSRPLFAAV